jgi:hypothetical protein
MIVGYFPKVSLHDTYFEHVKGRRQRTRHIPIFGARLSAVMGMVLKKFVLATARQGGTPHPLLLFSIFFVYDVPAPGDCS